MTKGLYLEYIKNAFKFIKGVQLKRKLDKRLEQILHDKG